MNKTERLTIFLCLLLLVFLFETKPTRAIENETEINFGVEYLSTHYHHEPGYLNDTEIRDFTLFEEEGLEYVTLVVIWKYFEPKLVSYLRRNGHSGALILTMGWASFVTPLSKVARP